MAAASPFYAAALAQVHDIGFRWMAEDGGRGVLEILRRGRVPDGTVVDLGCGSGIWARALTDAGYSVLGVDASAAMLKIARRTAPRARFVRTSFVDAELPPCDAVTAMGEVLGYQFDPRAGSPAALRAIFRKVYRALRPGGLFVFDLAEPGRDRSGRGRDGVPQTRAWHAPDWTVTVRAVEDPRTQVLIREITTFHRHGKTWRRSDEVHRLRLHRAADVAAILRGCGFTARIVRGYGALRFPPCFAGFVARRSRTPTDG